MYMDVYIIVFTAAFQFFGSLQQIDLTVNSISVFFRQPEISERFRIFTILK